jgi:hypothetical protein
MADTSLMSTSPQSRRYRLVDQQGQPHPELDEHFESSEEAWDFARRWWNRTGDSRYGHPDDSPIGLGVEVSTESGHWRTLRHPQG